MIRRVVIAALGGVMCASCLPVPFDLSFSKAAMITSRMTQDNPDLISAGGSDTNSPTDQAFYPSVSPAGGFDYSAGFATSSDGTSVQIRGIAGGSQYSSQGGSAANPQLWPLKSGVSYLFATSLDDQNPLSNGYGIFQGTPPGSLTSSGNGYYSLLTSPTPLLSFTSLQVVGVSVGADPSLTADRLHVLVQDTSQSQYYAEGSFPLDSTGPLVSSFVALRGTVSYQLPFIPVGTNRVLYFYDETMGRSYASFSDANQGRWTCYAWDAVGSYLQIPVTHPVAALLSNGQLLSMEDGTARVYDRDGALRATFDVGNLAFIAEEYVNGEARCYFSQALPYNGTQHFNVYWIATSRLSSLGS